MSLVTALAISIGVLGGIATFAVLGPLATLNLQIWAIFVAWACFYHCGGKETGLRNTVVNNVFGAVVGWITLLIISEIPLGATLGLAVWAGIVVFVMVFVLVIAAHNPMFAVIPGGVYGFAAVVAHALLGTKLDTLLAASMHNPLFTIVVSMVVGALLGWVSEKIAVALAASRVPQRA